MQDELESQEEFDDEIMQEIGEPEEIEEDITRPKQVAKIGKIFNNETFFKTEVTRLARIKKTQVEMIIDRGYEPDTDIEYLTISYAQFYDRFKDFSIQELFATLSKIYQNKNGDKLVVFYAIPSGKHLNSVDLASVFEMIERNNSLRKYIVISLSNMSPELKKQVNSVENKNLYVTVMNSIRIQIFLYSEMIFNPSRHFLVPIHRLITDEEKNELLTKYIKVEDLPKILETDIQVRYLGGEISQIIEVTRVDLNPYSDNIIDISIVYRIITTEMS